MSSQCFDHERLEHPVSAAYPALAPPSFPCRPGSSILIDSHFEGSLTERRAHYGAGKGGQSRVTNDILPDVALLEIFDFYLDDLREGKIESRWHRLVHVCRKWRNVVFGSPRRLNLRLLCDERTPARKMLDIWPPLPIIVQSSYGISDNIIAALEHNDRICHLQLFGLSSFQMEKVLAAMHQPFQALTYLQLGFDGEMVPLSPASFLGGSAPRLRSLTLNRIPFPGLAKLLSSTTHLFLLYLWNIPHSGYISPDTMATSLSILANLHAVDIGFESPLSRPDRRSRRPPPSTRILLPALTTLTFRGASEYLEDLVARIDAPLLEHLYITFFHQLIFDTPQLTQFISRTPKFQTLDEAEARANVVFSDWDASVRLPWTLGGWLRLGISCRQSDWQLSSLTQLCSSSFPQALISAVQHLYIEDDPGYLRPDWQDNVESSQWLELLHPFTAVQGLYISQEFMPPIAPALRELVGERVTEVLPVLQTLFFEEALPSGPVQESITQFFDARQLSGHPIVVSRWERKPMVISG